MVRDKYNESIEVRDDSIAAHLIEEKMDFNMWLQENVIKFSPFLMGSLGIHVVLLLVLSAISTAGTIKPPDEISVVDLTKKETPKLEEVEEEIKKEEIEKEEVTEREVEDTKITESEEEDDQIETPSPLKGKGVYDTIGIGGGLGGGRGRKGGRKKKAPVATENAVLAGLIWLAKHQNSDGSWGAKAFLTQCKGSSCGGPGDTDYDIGITATSLLAFLGAGYTPSSRDTYDGYNFGNVVKNAATYLIGIQNNEGVFGGVKPGKFMYNQSIAAYAISDLYGLTKDMPTGVIFKEPAQKAVDYIVSVQNPGKAWRYQPKDGQNDSSVSGWVAMALKAAEGAELNVPSSAFANIKAFYDEVTDPSYGRVGYTELGSVALRANEEKSSPVIQPSLTAIGIMVRIFIDKKTSDPVIKNGVQLILGSLPTWDTGKLGVIDYYYWFYASYCLNQYDGPDGPSWKMWNEKMKEVLLKSQKTKNDGCAYGSWDPIDRWGDEGSRVYSTAINVLTLEVYYRLRIMIKEGH
ncbi:MAG: hypothetical protein HY762_06580 [Planctomycetes bacterium]|nr:hypothetical protein [Planctomycetota bacterium]